MLIDILKKFDADIFDVDQLIELSALATVVQNEYRGLNVDEPEWLAGSARSIRREIRARQADRIEKMIREKKSRLEALMPAEDKRKALQAEIENLQARLGVQ